MATTALAPAEVRSIATVHELEVDDVIHQVQKIQHVMEAVMKPGEHYGVIPGTGTKPTLLKPGAEKLCLVFRLDPQYEVTQTLSEGAHLTVVSRCTLYHIPTSNRMGSGMGSCSTKESKYAYRQAKRSCPACGQEAIIKGKAEWGGGWVCHKKQGGCGMKYADADSTITGQAVGRIAKSRPCGPAQYDFEDGEQAQSGRGGAQRHSSIGSSDTRPRGYAGAAATHATRGEAVASAAECVC